jgi:hypothetical protein
LIRFGEDFFARGRVALVLRRGLHGEDDDGSSGAGNWARLARAMRIEGRGETGQLSGVTSPWDAQWKGVG